MKSNFSRPSTTAKRLSEVMQEKGMKPADLSRLTGIDRGSISHYLSGRYEPKDKAMHKLAAALNADEMWLWGYDVPKNRSIDKESEKENDIIADVIDKLENNKEFFDTVERMMNDKEFFEVVKVLGNLKKEKLHAIKELLQSSS